MGRQFTAEAEQEPRFKMIPEDTIHRARLDGIDEKGPFNRKDGTTFTKLLWWFVVTDGEFEGRKLRGETGSEFALGSKFHAWVEAMLSRSIDIGSQLDIDDLVGLSVDVSVKHVPDYKDPAKKWAEVDQVISLDAAADMQPPF